MEDIPLPLKLKRDASRPATAGGYAGEAAHVVHKSIVIISSKPLSGRAKDILSTAGFLRMFDFKKFSTWSLSEFIDGADYIFFNVSNEETMAYLSSQFRLLKDYNVVLLKHSYETTDEDWIVKINKEIACTIISHIPEERKKTLLDVLLLNTVALVRPESRMRKILKYIFRCVSARD